MSNKTMERTRGSVEAKRRRRLARLMREHKALKLPRDNAWLDFADLPSERVLWRAFPPGAAKPGRLT